MAFPHGSGLRDRTFAGVPAPVWGALLIVYVIWGSTYLAIREGVLTIPPFLLAAARFVIAGAVLYAWAVRRGDREEDRPRAPQWRAASIAGGLLLFGGNGGVVWAEQHIPTGVTALVIATVPLWMVVIGRLVFHDRVTFREVIGVVVGFGGLVILVSVGHGTSGRFDLTGLAVTLFAAVSWATGSLYSRTAPLPRRPLVSTAMQMLCGGALLLVAAAATGEFSDVRLSHVSAASWAGLAYLIVFGSLISFNAYAWLLRNARISLVATYAYVNPVVAVFLGWAVLGERITGVTVLAGGVIVVAVALIVSARSAARNKAEPVPAVPAENRAAG